MVPNLAPRGGVSRGEQGLRIVHLLVRLVAHVAADALDVSAEGGELRAHEDARARAHRHLAARDDEARRAFGEVGVVVPEGDVPPGLLAVGEEALVPLVRGDVDGLARQEQRLRVLHHLLEGGARLVVLEVATAHVHAAELPVPEGVDDALRRLDHLRAEVDVVAHEALSGHLQDGVAEPELLVELAEQVLPEVDHLGVDVLGVAGGVEEGRALAEAQRRLVALRVELLEAVAQRPPLRALRNAEDVRVPGVPGLGADEQHPRAELDAAVEPLVVLVLTQQPPQPPPVARGRRQVARQIHLAGVLVGAPLVLRGERVPAAAVGLAAAHHVLPEAVRLLVEPPRRADPVHRDVRAAGARLVLEGVRPDLHPLVVLVPHRDPHVIARHLEEGLLFPLVANVRGTAQVRALASAKISSRLPAESGHVILDPDNISRLVYRWAPFEPWPSDRPRTFPADDLLELLVHYHRETFLYIL
mmetsp:Transcript_26611/g.57908  ORF Transcript_26611/g.57908 Transcript_26611/m.57908 type:complete len:473 (+) Transcript_26611:718-2136(+)